MNKQYSLLIGDRSNPFCEEFVAQTNYNIVGNFHYSFPFNSPISGGFNSPVQSPVNGDLYIKISDYGAPIWKFDSNTGLGFKMITSYAGGNNFLIDAAGNLFILNAFGDVIKLDPLGVSLGTFIHNSSNRIEQPQMMQWAPNGDLCILCNHGSSIFPQTQSIVKFNGQNGSYLGELISENESTMSNGLWPTNYFTFGPDGNMYAGKTIGEPGILRFDGATGEFIDIFVNKNEIYQNKIFLLIDFQCFLFSPNGIRFFVILPDRFLEFDITGIKPVKTNEVTLSTTTAGLSTFITQEVSDLEPKYQFYPHISFLTQILSGVLLDNRGYIIPPGQGPKPSPGGNPFASQIWNDLSDDDKDAVVAFGIHELSNLVHNKDLSEKIQITIQNSLNKKLLNRLQTLIKVHGRDIKV